MRRVSRSRDSLRRLGLKVRRCAGPVSVSGGMRQRAALLRAYQYSRDFMLLDEPFSALDAFTKADMHTWFLDVAERMGTTSLIVTHDIDEAIMLADHIYVMRGNPQAGVPTTIVGGGAHRLSPLRPRRIRRERDVPRP